MQSDGTNLTVWFSRDGVNFTQVGAPQPLDRMTGPLLGVSAFNGTAGTPASFELFNLSTPSDEFDGTSLSDCRWTTVLRPVRASCASRTASCRSTRSTATCTTAPTPPRTSSCSRPRRPASGRPSTKVKLASGGSYEQGGLVLYKDSRNFIKLMLMDTEGNGFRLEFGQDVNGATTNVRQAVTAPARCRRASTTPASGSSSSVTARPCRRSSRWTAPPGPPFSVAQDAGRGQGRPRRLPRQRAAGAVRLLPSRKRQRRPGDLGRERHAEQGHGAAGDRVRRDGDRRRR